MKLFPRSLAYSLNAYLNAQISDELVANIRSEGKTFATIGTTAQQRASQLADTAKGKDMSYMIGLAYTQYYINGLADILYGRILFKSIISKEKPKLHRLYQESTSRFRKQLKTPHQFDEFINDRDLYLRYWITVLRNPWLWSEQFAEERCGYSGGLNKESLTKAAVEVQKQNSENNLIIAQKLKRGVYNEDIKTNELYRMANKYNDQSYLTEAVKTQEAAARWDKLFVKLIDR